MSGEMMQFPNNMKQFLDEYSFLDKERIYTNGSLLISTSQTPSPYVIKNVSFPIYIIFLIKPTNKFISVFNSFF